MHEYSLASAIVVQVKEIVVENKAIRVKKIIISAGPYELIIPELLQDSYKIITDELEKFKGSVLELLRKPARITCLECDYNGEPASEGDDEFAFNFKCPKCRSRDTHIDRSYLTIESVELELPE
jgi:Zn finger protein HypA/HybF involved in hydrogenase expression